MLNSNAEEFTMWIETFRTIGGILFIDLKANGFIHQYRSEVLDDG
jgi:hypothetical protein